MDIGQTSDDMVERSDTRVDRGQVPGFSLALAGLIFALTFPFASFIVSVVGMGLAVRAAAVVANFATTASPAAGARG